jgi:hypothetical protein
MREDHMSSVSTLLLGESPAPRVAGLIDNHRLALLAVQALHCRPGMGAGQVSLLKPPDGPLDEQSIGEALEPAKVGATGGVFRTPLLFTVVGLMGALFVWLLLAAADSLSVGVHRLATLLLSCGLGALLGFLVGGTMALQHGQMLVNSRVRRALLRGQWVIVVRPQSRRQTRQAVKSLSQHCPKVMRSF